MPRYAVTLDTSYICNGYDEIVVEAETAAKAKYKAAKCFGGINGMGGKEFRYFIQLFKPIVRRVEEDTHLWHKSFCDDNPKREMRLVRIGMTKERSGQNESKMLQRMQVR